MSAWGTGPFENDDAAAWGDDLDAADDPAAFAAQTLRDGDAPSRVVAAAAWFVSGLPGTAEPPGGPTTRPVTPDADLAEDAAEALGDVLADDTWAAQYDDPTDRDTARAYVRSLIETWEVAVG